MKGISHDRYDPMVFWVDSTGKLSDIPFIDHQEVSFFESLKSMIYATCLITMFILSQTMIISTDFPVNIWVVSLMVYAFHGSTFLQSGV